MTAHRLGRAPWTTAGELDDAQRALLNRIRDEWGSGEVGLSPVDDDGRLVGPFDLMAASPEVGSSVLGMATSFRYAELSAAERELVILVVAVAEDVAFMWEGHAPVAVTAGLPVDVIDAVANGDTPRPDEPWRTVHGIVRRLTADGDLDDRVFNSAIETLGWRRLQEIVWLTGLYQALGMAMRVARSPLPSQRQEG